MNDPMTHIFPFCFTYLCFLTASCSSIFNELFVRPVYRFEAGTPAIGEAIGLGAAVEYLSNIGMDRIHAYEVGLSELTL